MLRQTATRLTRPCTQLRLLIRANAFSTSPACFANRAVVYTETGNPADVLRVQSYDPLPPPPSDSVTIRFHLSPINPSDINLVQGVYPVKPAQLELSGQQVFVGGNEGVAEVVDVGTAVQGLRKGDRVVVGKPQFGTWSSHRVIQAQDVIKLPSSGLSDVNAATIIVNPPTAYNMLHSFVELKEGDWVLQNGANSAVGQAVIQIAARKGLKTINFVRKRPDLDNLIASLTELGATHVFTYDALADKSLAKHVKQWTSDRPIRLMLNCVSGKDTTAMTRLLGDNAHLVSYGAMSKQPLSLPTSTFIFKNLTAHGYWQNRWYNEHSRQEREELMRTITDLKLKEPEHEILDLSSETSDEAATQRLRETFVRMEQGFGKKVLLRL
ncbi:NAD(P)-binding protein [Lentinus brumalis]|uniref:enoyl-[acyl-carrier-protein] reductase n=1 Tax=Lentinus brumalis TaxID=2498619 RepID=A0A371DP55_9APHY|nr:NAD(P)-binding protein [Polyporus brumalis]